MNSRNPQRNISRLKLKKLKEDAKYNDQLRIDRNSYLLKSERLEDDIKELEAKGKNSLMTEGYVDMIIDEAIEKIKLLTLKQK